MQLYFYQKKLENLIVLHIVIYIYNIYDICFIVLFKIMHTLEIDLKV